MWRLIVCNVLREAMRAFVRGKGSHGIAGRKKGRGIFYLSLLRLPLFLLRAQLAKRALQFVEPLSGLAQFALRC